MIIYKGDHTGFSQVTIYPTVVSTLSLRHDVHISFSSASLQNSVYVHLSCYPVGLSILKKPGIQARQSVQYVIGSAQFRICRLHLGGLLLGTMQYPGRQAVQT